ncbi:hypothetical protein MPER_03064, partial [Moniliophthora perniciosa FA553]
MPLLTQSMAVFYETLRLFPPIVGIIRVPQQDTSILYNGKTIPVKKDTQIEINFVGMHYNLM